jgi:hypothetical protein
MNETDLITKGLNMGLKVVGEAVPDLNSTLAGVGVIVTMVGAFQIISNELDGVTPDPNESITVADDVTDKARQMLRL